MIAAGYWGCSTRLIAISKLNEIVGRETENNGILIERNAY
jgi:hypothetical protein